MSLLGPNSGATFADDATVGTIANVNPGNAAVSDNAYVTATLLLGQVSHYLKVTGFGFTVPADATITGILVEIERSATVSVSITDSSVKLVKGGTIGGTDKATGTNWPTSDAYASYGADGDLWGQTLTPVDVNASNFGVAIATTAVAGAGIQIDHIRITVYWVGSNRLQSQSGNRRVKVSAGMGQPDWVS